MTAKKLSTIHLLTGDDEYLMTRHAREIIDTVRKTDAQAEVEIIDGMVTTVSDAETAIRRCKSALQSPGLFSTTRVVWFKDVAFLQECRAAQSETVQDALNDWVELITKGLPDGFSLLITAESVDKRRAYAKTLLKIAAAKEFSRGDKNATSRLGIVQGILDQHACSATPHVIELLCNKVGSDTRRLVMETEKLCLYVLPAKNITIDAVEAIVSTTTETAFYELANRFCAFDLTGAVRTLHELLFQKHNVIGLISHLEGTIRDLLIFREALDQGWLLIRGGRLAWQPVSPEVEQALTTLDKDPRKIPPFIATRLAQGAERFNRKRLDHCLRQIVAAHEKMVSSRVPPELLLELLLVRMLGKAKRASA
jgi:DNA polymerase III delta subunit